MKRKSEEETKSPKKLKQTLLKFKIPSIKLEKQVLDEKNSYIYYCKHFLEPKESQELFEHIIQLPFHESQISMYGKMVTVPRLQLVMNMNGDSQVNVYSKEKPKEFTKEILGIKKKIEDLLKCDFNYLLLNYYRDGKDYISFHNDKEAIEEGKNIIASLSLGESRKFVMKNMETNEKKEFLLEDGSLLVMGGNCQKYWTHSVPKQMNKGKRINLTFRIC